MLFKYNPATIKTITVITKDNFNEYMTLLTTHTISGTMPIPTNNENILTINKLTLKNAVKRVSLLASEETLKIKFDLTKDVLSIDSAKREEGEASEKIEEFKYAGEPLVVAFNYRYLNQILNVIETDEVEIRLGKSNEPALFFNCINDSKNKEDYLARFLLMPLRLK